MLVRAVRSLHRGRVVRAVAVAVAIAATRTQTLVSQQPAPSQPKTHTVKRGDTLWDLAHTYLGDPFLWPEIYRLNTDVIEDPHWIYPGEVLKLPGEPAKVVAVSPPQPEPAAPTPAPAPAMRPPAPVPPAPVVAVDTFKAAPTVRRGEYIASPWVDARGGPRISGHVIESAEVPGIASADRTRLNLYDPVFFAPPAGDAAPEHARYLTYRLGPLIEDFGQIVIPTGIIEVTRAPRNGEAATGRVVALFGQIGEKEHLIPLDSGSIRAGRPVGVANGPAGKVRWVDNEPVLPSMQRYVVLDISGRNGVTTGDQIEFYQPRQKPAEGESLAIPEVPLGRAQVLRVTPYGATAIITSIDQPKLEEGTAARVAAKMP
ncbi:MAG TPA: LysM peptidoglycan-binding domain-containing protein [Gemmatimonadaceae bacterium]|nr:LysM peptidoglycan-binding domain-containing protein [Gemmatimonadaceae bacterium]